MPYQPDYVELFSALSAFVDADHKHERPRPFRLYLSALQFDTGRL